MYNRQDIKHVAQMINSEDKKTVLLGFELAESQNISVDFKHHMRMWAWLQNIGHFNTLIVCQDEKDVVLEMLEIRRIDLDGVTSIPKHISLFRNLEILNISRSYKLTKIPNSIIKLKYIRIIYAWSCRKVPYTNFDYLRKALPDVQISYPYAYHKYLAKNKHLL